MPYRTVEVEVDYDLEEFDDYDLIEELVDRKSTRLNSSHMSESRMPSSA